jgi:hypothetical protein
LPGNAETCEAENTVKRSMPRRRDPQKTDILGVLQPAEAQEVLRSLLKAHPKLRGEAEDLAKSMISGVSSEAIAEEVEGELEALDLEDLSSRAGKHPWGYVDPTDAAWELLQEAIDPIIDEMERQRDLGLGREALETCKGLLLGLYRVRNKKNDSCLGWAPDFPAQSAGEVLRKWSERGGKSRAAFPRSFVDQHVPEWRTLFS